MLCANNKLDLHSVRVGISKLLFDQEKKVWTGKLTGEGAEFWMFSTCKWDKIYWNLF